ncbi:hypothetical protein N2152v2_007909 [Parachlorella kessleri]
MFVAAGQPGNVKKIQASVATARKVFRIMRPLEALVPLITNLTFGNKPLAIEIISKLKPILMAIYFGADHIVWAQQAGILNNKELTDKAQKASLYGWFGGSLCTIVGEIYELAALCMKREGESEEEYRGRVAKARPEINKRLLVLIHALTQAALAAGLLELRPWKPRTVGFIGVVTSVMNCYMLFPSYPAPAVPKPSVKPPPKVA